MAGPCNWQVDYSACAGVPQWSAEDQARFEGMAVNLLWVWTGRRYGPCEATVRPCDGTDCPVLCRTGPGSCTGPWALELPGPVDKVVDVTVDGVSVDPATYRLDPDGVLVRENGAWPSTQDMQAPAGAPGTFVVRYMRGHQVPDGGAIAAGRLASELYKASCGDSSCELPSRVQSITRQGVTVAMLDQFEDLGDGHTGIWLIDAWTAAHKPEQVRGGGIVSIPKGC